MALVTTAVAGVAISGYSAYSASKAQDKALDQAKAAAQFQPFGLNTAQGTTFINPNAPVYGDVPVLDEAGEPTFDPETGEPITERKQIGTTNRAGGELRADQKRVRAGLSGAAQSAVDNQLNQATRFETDRIGLGLSAADRARQFNAREANRGDRARLGVLDEGLGSNTQGRTDLFGNVAGRTDAAGRADTSAFSNINRGNNLLDQDFQGVADEQLGLLRASARPFEERAVNSKFSDLFGRGVLSGTAGARGLGELAFSQEQADIERQVQSQGLAQTLTAQNQNTGTALINSGQAGLIQGQNANLAGASVVGNVGQQQLTGINQNLTQSFDAGNLQGEKLIGRGQQRVSDITGLLGFGQDLTAGNVNTATAANSGVQAIDSEMRNLIALGGNIGGQASAAGANVAQAISAAGQNNPIAGFLGGVSTSLLDKALTKF